MSRSNHHAYTLCLSFRQDLLFAVSFSSLLGPENVLGQTFLETYLDLPQKYPRESYLSSSPNKSSMGSCLTTTRERTAKFSERHQPLSQIRINPNRSEKSIPPNSIQSTWLDELPTNVCSQIAHFISNGKPCLDALRLAETSRFQCTGVLNALAFKFSNECLENDLESRWAAIFMGQVQEVEITSGFYEGCIPLLNLLKAPTLRKVTLFGEDGVMRTLAESASVKELTLAVTGDTTFETLNEMLYRLNLSYVSLICMSFYDEDDCAFSPLVDAQCVSDFAEACSKLSHLAIDCDHEFQEHPLWTLLKAVPSVEKTVINVDPPKQLLPRLTSFKSVEIGSNVSDWRLLVEELGPAVTLLETYCITDHPSLAKEENDFAILTNCPNMCDLEICIKNGIEESLLQILPRFKSLQRVAIRWVFALTGDNAMEYSIPLYHAPAPGVITNMIKACPDAVKFCLRCVRLSMQEQDEVLRILGNRVQEIEVSFNGQTEHTFDRIEGFLRCAIMYNHNLRKIELVEEDWAVRLCDKDEQTDKKAIEEQRCRLLQLLSVLRRRAPNLDDSDLRDHIADMEIPVTGVEVTIHHEDGSKTIYES